MTVTSSLKPFSIVISASTAGAQAVLPPLTSLTISDGLPVLQLRLSLSRCVMTSDATTLASARVSCSIVIDDPPLTSPVVFAAIGLFSVDLLSLPVTASAAPATVSNPCRNGGGALLSSAVFVGASYRAPQSSAALVCGIQADGGLNSSMPLALTSLPIDVIPTRWPLWDDAILVSATGAMRSARLGMIINATSALLAAGANPTSSLKASLASPTAVLAAARAVWEGPTMNYTVRLLDEGPVLPFSITLSGASRVVLFAGLSGQGVFSPLSSTNASLGGAACNISAVSANGEWAILDTPSAAALCGIAAAEAGDCGYAALTLASSPFGSALSASLACPPFCPGAVGGSVVPLATRTGFALGTDPLTAVGALPALLPSDTSGYSSEGIYYAAACAQTGLYTDPASGACTNASDPAAYACALGSGTGCAICPDTSLCPGGSRQWPRVGYWASSESAADVSPCAPPDPEVKCSGWNVSRGAVQCGRAYKAGSPLCSACSQGFYQPGDGSCIACPVIAGAWARYSTLILLLCIVFAASLCVGLVLFALVKCFGGTLNGSATVLIELALWSIAALQTVAQAAPASAAALPSFLANVLRGVAVLQLDGVLLPPACTGAYAFESQVRCGTGVNTGALCSVHHQLSLSQVALMGSALILAAFYLGVQLIHLRSRAPDFLQKAGVVSVRALLLLCPPAARDALSLLNCASVTVSPAACASLDGCSTSTGGLGGRRSTVELRILTANPFYVCWVPGASHAAAGEIAVATLAVVVVAFPLASFYAAWLFSRQQMQPASPTASSPVDARSAKSAAASGMVENPLRQAPVESSTGDVPKAAAPLLNNARVLPPLIAPFLADYRPAAWYTRHADLALTLLLAALQVSW